MALDRFWRMLRLRTRSIFRRPLVDRELDEELAYHVERRTDAYVAAGMPPAEARAAALRDMGGLARPREACREARGLRIFDDTAQDLRYAFRTLAHAPSFTIVAIVTLAAGIGSTVGIFTVVNAVLLRPLPIREPERLAIITAQEIKQHGIVGASWTKFELLRAHNAVFSDLAARSEERRVGKECGCRGGVGQERQ